MADRDEYARLIALFLGDKRVGAEKMLKMLVAPESCVSCVAIGDIPELQPKDLGFPGIR